MSKPTRDQVIALAGIFQACHLVETLSRSGSIPYDSFATCVHSIFEQHPDNTESVYGSLPSLRLGMDAMHELLTMQRSGQPSDTIRYVVGISHLQHKLSRNRKMLQTVGRGIERANEQSRHFSETHENVLASLADLYQNTLSTFRYRIQVNGYANYLQQTSIANRVRTLLLSAVRSAVLWNQLGGSRWHLVFYRKRILQLLQDLQREAYQ